VWPLEADCPASLSEPQVSPAGGRLTGRRQVRCESWSRSVPRLGSTEKCGNRGWLLASGLVILGVTPSTQIARSEI
jgi:hypothetical protein